MRVRDGEVSALDLPGECLPCLSLSCLSLSTSTSRVFVGGCDEIVMRPVCESVACLEDDTDAWALRAE